MLYTVKKTDKPVEINFDEHGWAKMSWDSMAGAETATLENIRQESSDHKPQISLRVLHDKDTIYGLYQVKDRYVKVTHVGYQASVCQDSCVEFFFKPSVGPGYFNLEMNAGGSYLFYYIRNHQRAEHGFADYSPVDEKCGSLIKVQTTLPKVVDPEITTPLTWYAMFTIPMAAIEPYCGKVGDLSGQKWSGNFYKCGDDTSHPHWITWAPIPVLNYHIPEAFQEIDFE